MNRKDFNSNKPRGGVFYPSVGEVWDFGDGSQLLIYKEWEKGFNCIGYNCDMSLNFNYLPEWWLKNNTYVKTLTLDEMAAVIGQRKAAGHSVI